MKDLARKALREGAWLGLFRALSQLLSWGATILVARILLPADYGLMEMATLFTGYIFIFNELGLGSALVQKEEVSQEELSSTFWFLILLGALLCAVAVLVAYPTAAVFHEPRLVPITQVAAVLFLVNSALIVPYRLFDRQVAFKKVGVIDFLSVVVSCAAMVAMALAGFGVWTLLGGHIVRQCVQLGLAFCLASWRPALRMRWAEVGPLLRFGANVAGARSLTYVYSKADRFFAGRAFAPVTVGYYAFALQLSAIPTDKIVANIQRVGYSLLARTQQDLQEFQRSYLNLLKMVAVTTFPLFIGGAVLADELIVCVLGEKWAPAVVPFQVLCIGQIFICVASLTTLVNNARGKPNWGLVFNLVNALLLPPAFYAAATRGLDALALPWVGVYPLMALVLVALTLGQIEVPLLRYLAACRGAFFSTGLMVLALCGLGQLQRFWPHLGQPRLWFVALKVLIGGGVYAAALAACFERELAGQLLTALRNRFTRKRSCA